MPIAAECNEISGGDILQTIAQVRSLRPQLADLYEGVEDAARSEPVPFCDILQVIGQQATAKGVERAVLLDIAA